jgi:hypothetical protein
MSYWGTPSNPIPLVTNEQNSKGTAETNLALLNTDKLNMETEYITFLSEYSPYSNDLLVSPDGSKPSYPITKDTPFFKGFPNNTT